MLQTPVPVTQTLLCWLHAVINSDAAAWPAVVLALIAQRWGLCEPQDGTEERWVASVLNRIAPLLVPYTPVTFPKPFVLDAKLGLSERSALEANPSAARGIFI